MKSVLDTLMEEEPYSGIAGVNSVFDAMQVLRETTALYHYRHFSLIQVPPTAAEQGQSLSRRAIMLSWPRELIDEFDRLGLFRSNRMLDRMRTHLVPFITDLGVPDSAPRPERAEEVVGLFARFGLTTGVHFPVMDRTSGLFLLSFMGDRGPLAGAEVATLALFATLLVERIAQLKSAGTGTVVALSPRELEVLQWTAEGKTSGDIARITNLSENTVNHYAAIAVQKLGCSNRTQAVVYAIRMGLFS